MAVSISPAPIGAKIRIPKLKSIRTDLSSPIPGEYFGDGGVAYLDKDNKVVLGYIDSSTFPPTFYVKIVDLETGNVVDRQPTEMFGIMGVMDDNIVSLSSDLSYILLLDSDLQVVDKIPTQVQPAGGGVTRFWYLSQLQRVPRNSTNDVMASLVYDGSYISGFELYFETLSLIPIIEDIRHIVYYDQNIPATTLYIHDIKDNNVIQLQPPGSAPLRLKHVSDKFIVIGNYVIDLETQTYYKVETPTSTSFIFTVEESQTKILALATDGSPYIGVLEADLENPSSGSGTPSDPYMIDATFRRTFTYSAEILVDYNKSTKNQFVKVGDIYVIVTQEPDKHISILHLVNGLLPLRLPEIHKYSVFTSTSLYGDVYVTPLSVIYRDGKIAYITDRFITVYYTS